MDSVESKPVLVQIGQPFRGSKAHHKYAVYQCQCGGRVVVKCSSVNLGHIRSCGCFRAACSADRKRTHGKTETPEFDAWCGMWARCGNPNNPRYLGYGGRGIRVCERWEVFEAFLQDMGPRPAGFTLERKDVNAGYNAANCVWADWITQANNKRTSRRVTVGNLTLTLAQWSVVTGLQRETIAGRLNKGWSPEEAVYTPVGEAKKGVPV